MKTTITALLLSLFIAVQASEIPKKQRERKPPLWDTIYYKNEISLDVSLPLSMIIGSGDFYKGALGLSYLRALTKKDYLRVSTRHYFESSGGTTTNLDNLAYNYAPCSLPSGSLIQAFDCPDSIITQTSKSYRIYSPDLRFGYEHRFGKRRIKAIVGVDVFIGAEMENRDDYHRFFKPGQRTDDSGNVYAVILQVEKDARETYTTVRSVKLKEGIAPFAGMFAHLSKRVSLRATVMYDFYWTQNLSFWTNSSVVFPPPHQFNLGFDAFVTEVAINVHF